MLVCPACDRHVLANARVCPFCQRALETTVATPPVVGVSLGSATTSVAGPAMTSLLLGLALAGCGDKTMDDEASLSGSHSVSDSSEEPAADYGDPSDTWDPPSEPTTGSMPEETGDSSGGSTGNAETDTDTDTDTEGDTDTDTDTEGEEATSR